MKNFEIQTRTDCNRCQGNGNYPHPAWVAFNEANPEHKEHPLPDEQIIAWMKANAFQSALDVRTMKGQEPREFLPNAEFACGDCGSTGKTVKWRKAADVFDAIVAHAIVEAEAEEGGVPNAWKFGYGDWEKLQEEFLAVDQAKAEEVISVALAQLEEWKGGPANA